MLVSVCIHVCVMFRMSLPHNLVFLPLGDSSGEVQVLVDLALWRRVMEDVKTESVVLVEGVVRERPGKDKKEMCAVYGRIC